MTNDEYYNSEETESRVQAALRGARRLGPLPVKIIVVDPTVIERKEKHRAYLVRQKLARERSAP